MTSSIRAASRLPDMSPIGLRNSPSESPVFVLTCEHGGYGIPAGYRSFFANAGLVLKSHRGWDPGALRVAQQMAETQASPLYFSTNSRLLIELNRSLGHRSLFSEFTTDLPVEVKEQIIAEYWRPWRNGVVEHIETLIRSGHTVCHLSVHSFTPVWERQVRRTSIGLLYDPSRAAEKTFCDAWKKGLRAARPDLTIHSNQPYRGNADGFTTFLRRHFSGENHSMGRYLGIEIEVNQTLIHPASQAKIVSLCRLLFETLRR